MPDKTDANRQVRGGAFIGWGALPVMILLLVNLFALVWGAATIRSTVYHLRDGLASFGVVVMDMQKTQAGIIVELAIVAERQRVMDEDVEKVEERIDKMESQ